MIFNVGAGGNNAVYLTQAEYDALPDSKLSNGVEYRITDANVGESIASNLAYDNSFSGIQAVNVQTAIDEVNDSLRNHETEEKNVGSWLGETLYSRVITTTLQAETVINADYIKELKKAEGVIIASYGCFPLGSCYYHGNALTQDGVRIYSADNKLIINCGTSWVGSTLQAEIFYTKN